MTQNVTSADDGDLISADTRLIFEVINYNVICSGLSLFGMVGNAVSMAVFLKQGLHRTVNVSFMALSISDFCGMVALQWYALCFNPLFVRSGVPMVPAEVQHLTGGFVKACFTRITCFITVFITGERFLCVTLPLKSRQLVTPRRAALIISGIYVTMMASLLPEYCTTYIGWKFYPDRNRTLLGLVITDSNQPVAGLTFLLYAIYIVISFLAEILLTTLLVVKLRRKTKWRQEATSDKTGQAENFTQRDRKAIRMVVTIATVLIVCLTPSVLISASGFLVPGFGVIGRYTNIFFVTWSFGFAFDSLNASSTIILYYTMSSKYRKTLRHILARCFPRFSDNQQ